MSGSTVKAEAARGTPSAGQVGTAAARPRSNARCETPRASPPVQRGHTGPLRATWSHDLEAYVSAQATSTWSSPGSAAAAPTPASAAAQALRAKLAQGIKVAPESAEAWWAFLQQEESQAQAAAQQQHQQAAPGATGAAGGAGGGTRSPGGPGVTLFDLYAWASRVVPRQTNYRTDAYLNIWLGYARQQWWVAGLSACALHLLAHPTDSGACLLGWVVCECTAQLELVPLRASSTPTGLWRVRLHWKMACCTGA